MTCFNLLEALFVTCDLVGKDVCVCVCVCVCVYVCVYMCVLTNSNVFPYRSDGQPAPSRHLGLTCSDLP